MKYIFIAIAFLVAVFACQWSFNHIDAWIGIFLSVAVAITFIYFLIHTFKTINKQDEKNN